MRICLNCHVPLKKYSLKYCCNRCQSDHKYQNYIESWKKGNESGSRGNTAKNISRYIVRFLLDKYESKCARCDWDTVSLYTKRVPLEIEHIDGNSENNDETNLILLCPNCHSLTSTYKGLNKGNGRLWRREKYVKIV